MVLFQLPGHGGVIKTLSHIELLHASCGSVITTTVIPPSLETYVPVLLSNLPASNLTPPTEINTEESDLVHM
jgi:hypothetical protein